MFLERSSWCAAAFFDTRRKDKPVFWIALANTPIKFRQNFVVEVNPPHSGIDRRFQGVFAENVAGRRFVLHRGRLHPKEGRVAAIEFFKHATVALQTVSFSDGSEDECAVVAPLDEGADACVDAMAHFVRDCANARARIRGIGRDDAEREARVLELEKTTPELRGQFIIPGRSESLGFRRHAEVWNVLHAELDRMGLRPANSRLGRFGPDMYTLQGHPPMLIEIKASGDSGSIQQGIGQLLIYEGLLGNARLKVLALPREPVAEIRTVLVRLGIRWLTYGDPDKPKFSRAEIKDLVRKQ